MPRAAARADWVDERRYYDRLEGRAFCLYDAGDISSKTNTWPISNTVLVLELMSPAMMFI